MTEAKWLAGVEPEPLLEYLRDKGTGRKLYLFVCACRRRFWHLLSQPDVRKMAEVSEQYVEGLATDEDLRLAAADALRGLGGGEDYDTQTALVNACVGTVTTSGFQPFLPFTGVWEAVWAGSHDWLSFGRMIQSVPVTARHGVILERSSQAGFLRDIFGNPFRPVSVDSLWLTSTVRALAAGIYEERAFDRMPILADALQDAGCDNDDILNHCRQSGEHVRGCWVVDLVLRKG